MFLKTQCSSGVFIGKCIKMLSAKICKRIVSQTGEDREHYEDIQAKLEYIHK